MVGSDETEYHLALLIGPQVRIMRQSQAEKP
jgi:hypothetical protein